MHWSAFLHCTIQSNRVILDPGKPIIAQEKHQCNLCTEFFLTKESFDCHLNLDHGLKTDKNFCRDCKQPYTNLHNTCIKTYKNPNPLKKKFVCTHCNPPKSFSSKQHYNEHISVQHEGKRYACSECDKTYSNIENLKSHVQCDHLQKEDFECEFCGKKFGHRRRLQNHTRQSHTQTSCEICNKHVNNRLELKKHMVLVHNDTKNAWICEFCPKKVFFTQSMFQKHFEAKH